MLLTILMPCLNEENNLLYCIKEAKAYLREKQIDGEILIVDNGSKDSSVKIAKDANVRVETEHKKGYGYALRKGIESANGDYIIMVDCDGTYDLRHLDVILEPLLKGYVFVCGNRFKGGIEKGAMPLSHKIGVKFLSKIGTEKYHVKIHDFHCGLRGFNGSIAKSFDYTTGGMEFATELISKFKDYRSIEVPVVLKKCRVRRKSHLRTIPDGMKHLGYMLKG